MKRRQSGFTLIELLVVIGILAVLMAIVLVAINPARQFRQSNNTRRNADINAILNAVTQYGADHRGDYSLLGPEDGTPIVLANTDANGVTLCQGVVPLYIASLPSDPNPTVGTGTMPISDATCTGGTWNTGYTVSIGTATSATGRVTVTANSEDIDTGAATVLTVTR